MLEQHHPNHIADSGERGRPTHLQAPGHAPHGPHSPNPKAQPLRSCLSLSPDRRRGHHRRRQSVHWDPRVVNNEHKMLARDQQMIHTKLAGRPAEQVPMSKPSIATTPKAINASVIKQPSSYKHMQSHRPILPSQPAYLPAHTASHTVPHIAPHTAAHNDAVANTEVRRAPSQDLKSHAKLQKVPPVVPDAPRGHPPAAPRPARLPTPDLPEIEESKFFPPKAKVGKPLHLKEDHQLDAATKHIQERKARG